MAVRRDEVNLLVTIGAGQAGNTLRDLKREARSIRAALERIPVGTKEFDEARNKLKQVTDQIAQAEGKAKRLGSAVQGASAAGGAFKNVMTAVLGVFSAFSLVGIVESLLQFGKQLFTLGTNLDQLQAKTRTVFGESETIVQGFAETNASALGLARQQYVNLATGIGDLLIPMGFAQDTAAQLSAEIVNQAGVLSEWSGGKVTTAEASDILNKALLGERDALNSLGIDIKDSLVQDELKKRGLQDLTGEARRQAEALVTLELITKQSASANEAFAKNGDSAARKQAELRARVQEVVQSLAAGFVPVVNRVLEVLGPAIEYIIEFGSRLFQAYQRAENFRAVVGGALNVVGLVIKGLAESVANLAEGFLNLFEGNFRAAFDSLSKAFKNPLEQGREIKSAFIAGFNSVKNPEVKVDTGKPEEEGKGFARAFGNGLDAEFAKLKGKGEKGAKEVAEAAKKALEARLKEVEAGYLKEELVVERALFNREISESDHARRILELKRTQYEQQLAAFKRFNQSESREALQAQKALLEVNQQLTRPQEAPVATLGARPGQGVQSQFAGIETQATVSALREKYANILQVEQEGELARLDFQRTVLEEKLKLLQEAGLQETEQYKTALAAKKEADEQYAESKTELERRAAEQSIRQQEAVVGVTQDAFDLAIELLSKDEAARKKNSAAIKALNVAQVTVSGVSEVAQIWKNAAQLGPILGPIIGAIQTAVAVGRTVAAISKIQAQKFAVGGVAKLGYFGGKPHSAGGTRGVFEDGTMLEVEAGEAFAIVNKRNAPLLRALSAVNAFGGNGVPFFEKGGIPKFLGGGLPTVSTTPVAFGNLSNPAAASGGNMEAFVMAVNRFDQVVQQFPTEVKSRVVYTELRDTAAEVAAVESEAAL